MEKILHEFCDRCINGRHEDKEAYEDCWECLSSMFGDMLINEIPPNYEEYCMNYGHITL